MDNLQNIALILLLLTTATLSYFFFVEKKKSKTLERQLLHLRGESEKEVFGRGKFSELGLMVAGITHEISNPLSIILGRLTQMKRMKESPDKDVLLQEGISQIERNVDRITKIIQGVRAYIYRDDERVEEFVSLKEVIDNILLFYGERLKNHGVELRLKNIDKVYLKGNKGQYEQALLNLISNAFDAVSTLSEKWIEISAAKNLETVDIIVTDSGKGIPLAVRSRMLDPFYSTKNGKGTGLGLSLVSGIAQKNGGELSYVEGPNTSFMLKVPQSSDLHYHY
jgi:C4-dicarboxylate-specific signal transduction histidine kinase